MIKKLFILIALVTVLASCGDAEKPADPIKEKAKTATTSTTAKEYEVGCGKCIYEQDGVKGCETWVKVDGKVVPLAGENINAHKSGLCEDAGKAMLDGAVKDGKFVATSATLVKAKEDHSGHNHGEGEHKH